MKNFTKLQKYSLITFGIYMLALIWVISFKCNMEWPIFMSRLSMGSMSLAERAEWSFCHFRFNGDGPIYSKDAIEDMLVNILLFLPVGMTLPMVFRRNGALITILLGFGISLAFEISQFFNMIGGFAYIDLITNTLGTALGVLLLYLIRKVVDDRLAVKILFVFQIIFSVIAIFGTVNTIINIDLYL